MWSSHAVAEAVVLRAEGRPAEALAAAERALAAREQMGLNNWQIKQTIESALATGNLDKARETLAILDGLRPGEFTPLLAAIGGRYGARIAVVTGEGDPREGFATAEMRYREIGLPFHLAMAQLEHGEWLVAAGEQGDATTLLAEAREVFERLRAAPWLERLDRARAGAEVHA